MRPGMCPPFVRTSDPGWWARREGAPLPTLRNLRCDLHRQAFEPAQGVVVAALDLAGDLDFAYLAGERCHHHLALEAGDQLPDAHMNSGAVADVAGGAAGDVVAVGILPALRIAIGCGEEHQHLLAFADDVSADLD